MTITGHQLIGDTVSRTGTQAFTGYNRLTNEPLEPPFYEATPDEINQAVALADAAFWLYRKKSGTERAAFLDAIADEVLALGDQLIQTAMRESALPEGRLLGERGRTLGQLKLFADFIRDNAWVRPIVDPAQPDRTPLSRPELRQQQMALGPVAVFGASNFPFAFSVAGGDTVSALAAGCPVVFKAHPAHPTTCELVGTAIVKAAQRTGMPAGVFSMVHGISHQVGESLVAHPLIKAVGFTGSYRGGKALYDLAVRRDEPIPVYAEMGSTNPVFFLPGALAQNAANLATAFAGSITLGMGQFCTNPGLFVIPNDQTPFAEQVADKLNQATVSPLLTEGIQKAYLQGIAQQQLAHGTTVLTDWNAESVRPHLLLTTVGQTVQHPELTEEVFGPSTVGVVAESKADMLAFARNLRGHLTATIHGTEADLAEYEELVAILTTKVGRILFNGFPTGVEVSHAMVHGGPFPATTDSRTTSVGTTAIYRFTRPVCFQDFPVSALPAELR